MPDMIELREIGKEFPGVRALSGVSLSIVRGEVLGLVGENGAGKSTLIKILGGVYGAGEYEGQIVVGGRVAGFRSTRDARKAGIAVVHQELSLVPEMSVAENLLLGREVTRWGVVDAAASEQRARAILERTAGEIAEMIDVREPAGRLGVGMQQVVEIARAFGEETSVVVLDEPTAALTGAEAERLFTVVRERRADGASFVYISHHLDEVMALCDRVAVLRDGKLVAVRRVAEVTREEIVGMMTGGGDGETAVHVAVHVHDNDHEGEDVLEVEGLTVRANGRVVVDGLSFGVRAGEIVALAGAMGAGRTATLSALFGMVKGEVEGVVKVDGRVVTIDEPRDAIEAGLALVPEDRKGVGLVLGMSVEENLGLAAMARRGRLIDGAKNERAAEDRVKELRIKVPGLGAEVATLSGGNQQKVVIGKWLELAPRVLLLDEPTRGVDVGAKAEIYRLVEELVGKGHAVVMASSDLPEIVRLADRVLVLRDGRLAGELGAGEINELAIMNLAMGTEAA